LWASEQLGGRGNGSTQNCFELEAGAQGRGCFVQRVRLAEALLERRFGLLRLLA
jgi:hypothetical protein